MSNTKLPTTCADCGKRTNKVNRSEMNIELCNTCYAKAELELSHQEGEHTEYVKACYLCNEERNKDLAAAQEDANDHWVDVHTRRQAGCIACDAVAANDIGQVDPVFYEATETDVHIHDVMDQVAEELTAPAKQAHFDHSACDHPKTAKDRAQCRKTGPAAVFHGVLVIDEEPAITEMIDREDRTGAAASEADFDLDD